MVNSITNTQAIIIDKIDKSDLKSGRSANSSSEVVSNIKKNKQLTDQKDEVRGKIETEKAIRLLPNYDKIKIEIEDLIQKDLSVDFEFVEVNNKEKMVITINDKETGKVIKRIPSEVTISIMKHLFEKYGMGQITNAKV